jgi:hypothetical protein
MTDSITATLSALQLAQPPVSESLPKVAIPSKGLSVQNTTTTFEFFSALPGELQLKVWSFALPGPRAIKVYPSLLIEYEDHETRSEFVARSDYIPLLAACHDSRTTVLNEYRLTSWSNRLASPIYFNAAKDIVFLDWTALEKIESVARLAAGGSYKDDVPETHFLRHEAVLFLVTEPKYVGEVRSGAIVMKRLSKIVRRFGTLKMLVLLDCDPQAFQHVSGDSKPDHRDSKLYKLIQPRIISKTSPNYQTQVANIQHYSPPMASVVLIDKNDINDKDSKVVKKLLTYRAVSKF